MELTQEQKELLMKHNISFKDKYEDYDEAYPLLDKMDEYMLENLLDERDEPLPEFLKLQKLYDDVVYSFE